MFSSLITIAERVAILAGMMQFLLDSFGRDGKQFHCTVILLSSSLLLHFFDPCQSFCVMEPEGIFFCWKQRLGSCLLKGLSLSRRGRSFSRLWRKIVSFGETLLH